MLSIVILSVILLRVMLPLKGVQEELPKQPMYFRPE
jgi:hypothetical protein